VFCLSLLAQEEKTKFRIFQFTTIKEIPVTPVKNQANTGTCWSFSALGLIEADLLRLGKGEHDLSEMFIVHKDYEDKAQKYVRMNGKINFAAGGSFADLLECIKDYGIVPDIDATEGPGSDQEHTKLLKKDSLAFTYFYSARATVRQINNIHRNLSG
jgi:aminopeptidase C